MRTYHITAHVKPMKRSEGRSAVSAAAYRSGEKLYDERTDTWHDYTNRYGVEHSRIYLPEHAPEALRDRQTLWNAAEKRETRVNSCVAKELIVSFPHEFHAMQRREAGHELAQELINRYGVAVDVAYHKPDKNGDQRNYHAHIMFTDRGFDGASNDGWAKNKYRDLSNDRITIEGNKTSRGSEEIKSLRLFSANVMNRIAQRDGLEVNTTSLSFKELGINQEPQIHLGPVANDMEKKGNQTERGEENRKIKERNSEGEKSNENANDKEVSKKDEFAGMRRADFQQWKWDQQIEDERRVVSERRNLAKNLHDWYGEDEKQWKKEIKELKGKLHDGGVLGFMQKLSGKKLEIKDRINELNLNLYDSKMRKKEYIAKLSLFQNRRWKEIEAEIKTVEEKVEIQIARDKSNYRDEDSGDKGGKDSFSNTIGKNMKRDNERATPERKPSYSGSAIEHKKKEKSITRTHSSSVNKTENGRGVSRQKKRENNLTPRGGPNMGR